MLLNSPQIFSSITAFVKALLNSLNMKKSISSLEGSSIKMLGNREDPDQIDCFYLCLPCLHYVFLSK